VAPHGLGQATLPASPLTPERAEVFRSFGPRDRIRDELDPVRLPALEQMAVQAHDHLDVLADRVGRVAAGRLEKVAPEEAEGARDDEERTHPAPPDAADEEGAEVLDDLEGREPAAGQTDVDDAPVLDTAPVGDPDDAPRRDHDVGIVEDRLGDAQERVLLEQDVGVHRADVGIARPVEPAIEGVGLAAVVLVDHPELWMAA
jgi:hypothetical protein